MQKVARSMAPVLVHGESGTGKELVARAIHDVGARAAQPFIAVNCGAIPEQLLEAEFFGYRKGAFTGAAEDRAGFFQAASGGTLFLDEIGDLPLAMQSKLLRAVQERAVRPVGAVAEQAVNVRLLSATHKDLAVEVEQGRFRQDLYYRLNVIRIRVPPLRERMGDLPEIAARVLERIARDMGDGHAPRLSDAALARLCEHGFPGNVRELENLLHRAVALCDDELIDAALLGLAEDAPTAIAPSEAVPVAEAGPPPAAGCAATAAEQPRSPPGRDRARRPAACPRAAPLQPHRRRSGTGPVVAPDALPDGTAADRQRGEWPSTRPTSTVRRGPEAARR